MNRKTPSILPHFLFFVLVLGLTTLACNFPRDERTQDEIIDDILDEWLDELADADGCDRSDMRARVERAFTVCRDEWWREPGQSRRECIEEEKWLAADWAQLRCGDIEPPDDIVLDDEEPATPTATPSVAEDTVAETATVTYVDHVVEPPACTQEQEGHFFFLTCDFTLQVEVDYQVPTVPAQLVCSARSGGNSGNGFATQLVEEPAGNVVLTIALSSIRDMYEDDDANGAADPPIDDGDNMFTNPDPDNDGRYSELTCFVGETQVLSAAWAQFTCPSPLRDDSAPCMAPWLSLADAHTWD